MTKEIESPNSPHAALFNWKTHVHAMQIPVQIRAPAPERITSKMNGKFVQNYIILFLK